MANSSGNAVLYSAVYDDVDAALADLDAFEDLHKAKIIGKYDAAVVDNEDGEAHIVKRVDRPAIRVIPEWLGSGTLARHDLHEAGRALGAGEAALFVVGESTLEKGFEQAVTRATKTTKRELNTATAELEKEVTEAEKDATEVTEAEKDATEALKQ
jgi:hypothetical protein